jgi:hypothetical protein
LIDHVALPRLVQTIFLKLDQAATTQPGPSLFRRNRLGNQHGNGQASKNTGALGVLILDPCHRVKPAYGAIEKETLGG